MPKLIESEERLRFALTAANLGQWDLDLRSGQVSRTSRHDQIFGYSSPLPDWSYEKFLAHVLPAEREAVDTSFKKALAIGGAWHMECRIRRFDGAVRHIWTKALIQRDEEGKLLRMLGIVGDDTEQRRSAQSLLDSDARLRLLDAIGEATRSANDPLLVMTTTAKLLGEYLRAMRCAYADFEPGTLHFTIRGDWALPDVVSSTGSYSLEHFGSRAVKELSRGQTLVLHDTDRELATADGVAMFDSIGIKAIICCPLVKDGRLVAMMAVHNASPRDWSETEVALVKAVAERSWAHIERLHARALLSHSEAQLRHLLAAVPGAIFTATADGTIDYMSRWMYDFCGRNEAGPGFTLEYWPEIIHADDVAGHVASWMDSRADGRKLSRASRMRRADGSYHWFSVVADAELDAAGRIVKWYGYAVNIQDRMEALERLSASEEALRAADRRKDEFLATLAHELRNPLAPLRNALDLMRLMPDDPKILGGARKVMDRQLSQMVRLVDDLLDVSRVSRGVIELRRERLPLAAALRGAVEMSRPLIDEAGQTLELSLPPDTVQVDADATRLVQVFCNLLNNAAKYTDRGGHIRLTANCTDDTVTVSVRDDGIGIAAEMLPRVFDLFAQVESSRSRARGGLGIGLMLAKKLVEMHGGGIEARSAGTNAGSEFVVRLPRAADPEPATAPGPANLSKPGCAALRIIVADDNVDAADTLVMTLDLLGHEPRVAYDGEQALALAESFKPQVMLLDLGMPRLDGFETAKRARAAAWGSDVVLIALSGWGQDEDRRRSQAAGFDIHLVKPLDLQMLEPVLAELGIS